MTEDISTVEIINDEEPKIPHKWGFFYLPVADHLFLCGYCPNCQKSVTAPVSKSHQIGQVRYTQLKIDRYGCDFNG